MNLKNLYFLATLTFLVGLTGCSSTPRTPDAETRLDAELAVANGTEGGGPSTNNEIDSANTIKKILANLNVQVQTLDNKVNLLIQKIEEEQQKKQMTAINPIQSTSVARSAADRVGTPVLFEPALQDPDGNFVHDEAIQDFRKAMILFQGEKYPESVLAFSDFIGKYPDHTLAGSAQFYIGEAYFHQKEYKLAVQEFQTVLGSYDKSIHVTEALRDIAAAEEQLKNTQAAAKHRQLLSSLFPQSPAAAPEAISVSQAPIQATERGETSTVHIGLDEPPSASSSVGSSTSETMSHPASLDNPPETANVTREDL